MSTAFISSPSASPEGLDGFHSGMRLDTQLQRPQQQQQQDAQSFLSSESPFEEIGLSPQSSFFFVSPEGSIHTHGSDIGAEDWQPMPSPRGFHGAPYTSTAEARQAQPFTAAASGRSSSNSSNAQHIPRNLSVTSSLSSVAASAGHRQSPISTSPAQQFRRGSPYYAAAAAAAAAAAHGPQPTFAEPMYRWTTAAPMQTLTSAVNEGAYFHSGGLSAVPPSHVLPSNTTTSGPSQGPWSVYSQPGVRQAPADTMMFPPEVHYTFDPQSQASFNEFTATFTSAPGSAISPSTTQSQAFNTATWTFQDPFGVYPIDQDSHSDATTDARSRSHLPDDTDTSVQQPPVYRPSPMVKTEPNTPPMQDSGPNDIHILQYEPATHQPQHLTGPVRSHDGKRIGRIGGRSIGLKFDSHKAEKIKQRREDGACWRCSLQRDECSSGDVCRRCERRQQRPNADVVLMCDRTRLPDLKGVFVPPILTSMYERKAVEDFARIHIARWYKKPIQVPCKLIWGFEPINVTMYEFVPKDEVIRQSHLAIDNHRAQQTLIESRKSAPLGMISADLPDVLMFSREFDDIVDQWLDVFVSRFYAKDEDDFASRLLELMAELGRGDEGEFLRDEKEHNFLREVFRLLVITYVFSHAVTIAESQRHECLSQLQSTHGPSLPKHCGSKLANRQLKYMFSSIRDSLTNNILKQLSQFLRSSGKSSKRYSLWTSTFCAILGLAIALEQSMQLVHLIYHTEAKDRMFLEVDAEREGVKACEGIEDRFIFLTKLFRLKYHAKFNPLRDHEQENVREHLSPRQLDFVRGVASLCAEKGEYLRDRAHVRIAPENAIKYTARLVSPFLLSFWPPT